MRLTIALQAIRNFLLIRVRLRNDFLVDRPLRPLEPDRLSAW
jgi:hypothetical protein